MLEPILQESHLLTLEAKVDSIDTTRPYKIEGDTMESSMSEMSDNYVSVYDYRVSLKLTLSQVAIRRGCVNDKGEPQIAGLFVPVSLSGKVFPEPEYCCSGLAHEQCGCFGRPVNYEPKSFEAYQQARERMLFKGVNSVTSFQEDGMKMYEILYGKSGVTDVHRSTTLSELAQATKDEPLEILKR